MDALQHAWLLANRIDSDYLNENSLEIGFIGNETSFPIDKEYFF
jgi:hypothetical protein